MIRILLIRHALTDTAGKRLTGRSPGISLNDEGKKQAQELASRLRGLPLAAIVSSPLERAMETAGLIAGLLNLNFSVSEDFMEVDYGDWTNITVEELRKDRRFSLFNSFRSCTRIPGGELMSEAQMRIIKGIEDLHLRYDGSTVAVVSHADLIKSAIAWYIGMNLDFLDRIEISPASVSIIELYNETVRIKLVNDTGRIKT